MNQQAQPNSTRSQQTIVRKALRCLPNLIKCVLCGVVQVCGRPEVSSVHIDSAATPLQQTDKDRLCDASMCQLSAPAQQLVIFSRQTSMPTSAAVDTQLCSNRVVRRGQHRS